MCLYGCMTSKSFPVHMRFGDIDSYGHANNVIQLQYFEDARVRLSEMPVQGIDGIDGGTTFRTLSDAYLTVVGRQEVEYLSQLYYRLDPIYVQLWTSHIGVASYVLNYRLQERDSTENLSDADGQSRGVGTVYAVAQSTTVQIDRASGRPTPLTDQQRRFLEFYQDEPVMFRRRPTNGK